MGTQIKIKMFEYRVSFEHFFPSFLDLRSPHKSSPLNEFECFFSFTIGPTAAKPVVAH